MYLLGLFLTAEFHGRRTPADLADLDFFPFPTLGHQYDAEKALDAPIDGFMISCQVADARARTSTPPRRSSSSSAKGSTQTIYVPGPAEPHPDRQGCRHEQLHALQKKAVQLISRPRRSPSSSIATRARTSPGPNGMQAFLPDLPQEPDRRHDWPFQTQIQAFWDQPCRRLSPAALTSTRRTVPDPSRRLRPRLAGQPAGGAGADRVPRRRRRYSLLTRARQGRPRPDGRHPAVPRRRLHLGHRRSPRSCSRSRTGTGSGRSTAKNIIGLKNYQYLFTGTYPFFWPAVEHNLIWLLFFDVHRHAAGDLLRGPARPRDPRHAHLPERLLPAGRAVAGRHRLHLGAPVRAGQRLHQQRPRPHRPATT